MTVASTLAPDFASRYSVSAALNRVLTGTTIPPATWVASATITHSQQFGAQTATRSPFPTPIAMRPRAARSTSPRRSA